MNLGQLAIQRGLMVNRHPMIDRERATTEQEWIPSSVGQQRPEVSPLENPADDSSGPEVWGEKEQSARNAEIAILRAEEAKQASDKLAASGVTLRQIAQRCDCTYGRMSYIVGAALSKEFGLKNPRPDARFPMARANLLVRLCGKKQF